VLGLSRIDRALRAKDRDFRATIGDHSIALFNLYGRAVGR
jgi:hypothetical protein